MVRAECFEWRRSKNAISEGRGGSSMSLFLEAKSSSKVDKAAERHAAAAKVRSRPHWRLIGSLPSTVPALEHARNPSAPRECSRRLTMGPEKNVLHQIYHGRCTHSGTRWGASVLCQTHGRPGFRVCRGDRPLAVTAEAAVRNLETGGPAKISVNHTQSKNRERTQSEPDVC